MNAIRRAAMALDGGRESEVETRALARIRVLAGFGKQVKTLASLLAGY